jgi:hypothetical protein
MRYCQSVQIKARFFVVVYFEAIYSVRGIFGCSGQGVG